MKRIVLLVAVVVLSVMPWRASAEEYATSWAISPDGKIGVAVHAYSTGTERKRHEMWVAGKKRDFYPVGLMIQNYGDEEVIFYNRSIGMKPNAVGEKRPSIYPLHPYGQNTVSSKELTEDAARLNGELKLRRSSGSFIASERTNAIFRLSTLEPNNSYYGLFYLEMKGDMNEGKRPESLDDAYLYVALIDNSYGGGYVARLPLGGGGQGAFVDDDKVMKGFKKFVNDRYLGPAKEKPTDEVIYRDCLTLAACRDKAQAAATKDTKASSRKGYVWADVTYDRYGDMVSSEVRQQSSDEVINEVMQKVVNSAKHCDGLLSSNSSGQGRGMPFYGIAFGVGDPKYKKEVGEREGGR